MNFEEIKKEMNEEVDQEATKAPTIDLNRGKNNPVEMIRSNMRKEIVTQLVCIVIFMTYPLVIDMLPLNEAVYYIFMFITSLMTIGYIIKLGLFLNKTRNFATNTKDAIRTFIFEAKLTLEVYKSFIIAGSLLLPLPVFALLSDNKSAGKVVDFERWFLLDISSAELIFLIIGYLILAVIIYFITVGWAKLMYGKYLRNLEGLIEDLDA
ncbi:MAG: hypothetical protein GQ574_28045 [Crocinitomix sp.]|nr:hypothetical protein [Crocinitomix sp.]